MNRKLAAEVTLGKKVKLTPQGKIYTIATCDRNKVYLRDEFGKDKPISFQTSVYVLDAAQNKLIATH